MPRVDLDVWLPARHALLQAAWRHGAQAIDGPYLAFTDEEAQKPPTDGRGTSASTASGRS